jgi:DNA repair protein RadD
MTDAVVLRDYQLDIEETARQHFREVPAVLIQLATGAGKSLIGASICKKASLRGQQVFWITHRRELIKQVSGAFTAHRVEHSFIAAGFTYDRAARVHICSLETLRRRLGVVPTPDLIVWDEARHLQSATWSMVYQRWPQAWHLGLDATPTGGLGKYFQRMVCGPPVQDLIDRGYLAKYRLFAPKTPDTSKLHLRANEFITDELEEMFDRPTVVGDAISHYEKFASGKRALVFCVSVEASKHMEQAFREAGYQAVHADGNLNSQVRDTVIADFQAGRIQILCNVGLFTEGLDVVGVECILQLRPTNSVSVYLQIIGRGLRPAPGKTECIIIDACANWRAHGLPSDPRDWSLKDDPRGRAKPRDRALKICRWCFAAAYAGPPLCPNCQRPFPIESREVKRIAGELGEVSGDDLLRARQIRDRRQQQGRAKTLEELEAYGRIKGYKPGWARRIYAARQLKQ